MEGNFTFDDLISAIKKRKLDRTKEICEANPGLIDEANIDEWGPIHFCAAYGDGETLAYLIQKGANKEQKTREDWTPFLLAAWQGNDECLRQLLKAGANFKAETLFGHNLLSILCEKDEELQKIVYYGLDPEIHFEKQGDNLFLKGSSIDRLVF